MSTRLLGGGVVGCLVAVAAWMVDRNDRVCESVALSAEPQAAKANNPPEKHHETALKGLEYLVRHQHVDGHWEGDGGKHPVAMTALVGLALYMAVDQAKYSDNVRKATDWLIRHARREGLVHSGHDSETSRYMEGHGLATLLLAGVSRGEHDEARHKQLADLLRRAVSYIGKAQSTQGGWYHTSSVEGHDFDAISATVIQVQALQAAENSFLGDGVAGHRDALEYLKTALGRDEKGEQVQRSTRLAHSAAALACHLGAIPMTGRNGVIAKLEIPDEWNRHLFEYCKAKMPMGRDVQFGRDELAHYYYAQALFHLGGTDWDAYRAAMFDRLQGNQTKDGNWPASDGISAGPVYSTALWCIILQLDKNSHPARRQLSVMIQT
jgi:hypothetical protein